MKETAHETVKIVQGLEPKDYQATGPTNGAGVDTRGFDECAVELHVGVITGAGTLDVHVEHSDDNVTFANVTGAVFTQKVAASDQKLYVGRLELRGCKRYVRAAAVGDGSNAALAAVAFVLLGAQRHPVSQVETLAFNVTL